MNDMTPDELALTSGGVPIRGGLTSAADLAEEEEEEEEEEDTLDPADIRRAKTVVIVRADTVRDGAARPPTRLTFGTVDASALSDTLSPREDPMLVELSLDHADQIAAANG